MDAEGNERPESDDEDEDEDDEDDPGSGEIVGEDRPYRLSKGHSEGVDGIVDVDDDEESDADEEETETARRGDRASHQANGFRVAAVDRGGGDEDVDYSGEEIDEEGDGDDEDVVEVHGIDDSDDDDGVEEEDDEEDDEEDEEEEVDNEEGDFGEPGSTGLLTSTEGEIDGHEQGEDDLSEDDNGETGEDEQGVDNDGIFEEEDGEEVVRYSL